MSLQTILILNAAAAAILVVLLARTMRLPFRLEPPIAKAERLLLRRRPERAPTGASDGDGRRLAERPNLGEPAYSTE